MFFFLSQLHGFKEYTILRTMLLPDVAGGKPRQKTSLGQVCTVFRVPLRDPRPLSRPGVDTGLGRYLNVAKKAVRFRKLMALV